MTDKELAEQYCNKVKAEKNVFTPENPRVKKNIKNF